MTNLTMKEYLKYIEEAARSEKTENFLEEEIDNEPEKMPTEVYAGYYKVYNATTAKQEDIIKALNAKQNIRIGKFIFKINVKLGKSKEIFNVSVLEVKKRYNSSAAWYLKIEEDNRFNTQSWAKLFHRGTAKVDINTSLEIILRLKAIDKFVAFI